MIRARVRQLQPDVRDRSAPRGGHCRLFEHSRSRLGNRRPGEAGADAARLRARGGELLGMLDQRADCLGERGRIAERDDRAGARAEHVVGVQERRRDDGTTRGERERQRARRALLAVRVRRHEDIRRRQQIGELLDREEAVVELDVVVEPEVEDPPLEHEAVLLALPPRDLRMGASRDQIERLGMAVDDRG